MCSFPLPPITLVSHYASSYRNMDYICWSVLSSVAVFCVWMSYDIACQWALNFFTRLRTTCPQELSVPGNIVINFLVPKFHLPAHVPACYGPYSFNFARGVGRTDGEGVERLWSWLNGVAKSVSVMSPASRWDTLDDFCNFANWRKTLGLGMLHILTYSLWLTAWLHSRFPPEEAQESPSSGYNTPSCVCGLHQWPTGTSRGRCKAMG